MNHPAKICIRLLGTGKMMVIHKEVTYMKPSNPFSTLAIRRAFSIYMPMVVLVSIFTSIPLHSQPLVKPVNLVYLAQRADVIVQGRVTEVIHEGMPGYPNIPTVKVTLEVERMLRGPAGDAYTFRQIYLGLHPKTEKQDYRIGQNLLLFLPIPSKYGLSSPIGNEQGRFHITSNGSGSPLVINEIGNIGLFTNVAATGAADGRPVRLDEFISLVQNLMLTPRIR